MSSWPDIIPAFYYEREFQELKPHDPVQFSMVEPKTRCQFIVTAGHGYLVVPKNHPLATRAKLALTEYGYEGKSAFYLEEDCELPALLELIP